MAGHFRSPANVARRLTLTRLASQRLENWPRFMYNYAWGLAPRTPYRFRNGARLLVERGIDHAPIVEIFLRRDYGSIPDRAVIIDIGASVGVFSIYAATVARDVRIHAYEPDQRAFRVMEANVRLNRLDGIVTCSSDGVAGAAGNRELFLRGKRFLFPSLERTADGGQPAGEIVYCTTLTHILEVHAWSQVDLVKIDAEGAEYEILYSTRPEVFARIRAIRMEYHGLDTETRNVGALSRFLVAHGYTVAREHAHTSTDGFLWLERQ